MVGIIGAMQIEVDALIEKLENKKENSCKSYKFFEGRIGSKDVVVCCCGVGKVNSSTAAVLMIQLYQNIEIIINIGVAGGIKPDIKQGDIVVAENAIQHDFDATADGQRKGKLPNFDFLAFPCDSEAVAKMEQVLKNNDYRFFTGTIVTGDQFIDDKEKAVSLHSEYVAYACDMETAAIAQACYLLDTKFMAMRAISDNGDGSAVEDFYSFVEKAAAKSINAITEYLERI